MSDATFFLIGLVVVVLVVVAFIYSYLEAKKRGEELAGLARELGWRFDSRRRGDWDDRYSQFGQFKRGHSRYAYNVLDGWMTLAGVKVSGCMGDYTYSETTSNGKDSSTTTYRFSFLLVQLPFRGVPQLAVRREHLFDKIGAFMGFDDIDFESEEFSRRFHVASSDKRFAYDVISPAMMEFMLDTPTPRFEINGGWMLVAESDCWRVEEFKAMLKWTEEFFARWPRHVVADLTSRVTG